MSDNWWEEGATRIEESGNDAGGNWWEQGATRIKEEPEEKGFLGHAKDLALSVGKGVIAVPEAAVGLADIATGGQAGKFLENQDGAFGFRPKEAKAYLDQFHTDGYKAQQKEFEEADGIMAKAGVALSNPSMIANTVAESLPLMLGGAGVARGVMAAAAPKAAGYVAGAIGEGVVGAGSAAEQIRQQTEDGELTGSQSALAAATGLTTGLFGAAGGKMANRLGIGDIDTMLLGRGAADVTESAARTATTKSIPRQAIEGAISEGLLEELPQSVSEQLLQNLALNKPWDEGMDGAIVMGTLAGMGMGGPAAAFHGFTSRNPAASDSTQTQTEAPEVPQTAPLQIGNDSTSSPDSQASENDYWANRMAQGPQGFSAVPPESGAMPADWEVAPEENRPLLEGSPLPIAERVDGSQPLNDTPPLPAPNESFYNDTPPPLPPPIKPSEAMGLDPNAGAMSAAAALAVDSGAHETSKQQFALPAPEVSRQEQQRQAQDAMQAQQAQIAQQAWEQQQQATQQQPLQQALQQAAPEQFAGPPAPTESDLDPFDQPSEINLGEVQGTNEQAQAPAAPPSNLKDALAAIRAQKQAQNQPQAIERQAPAATETIADDGAQAQAYTESKPDQTHLNALEVRLSNERVRLEQATTDKERTHRAALVQQAANEVSGERKFLGLGQPSNTQDLNDDELLAALNPEQATQQPAQMDAGQTWASMQPEERTKAAQAAGLNKPQVTKALTANSIADMPAAIADKLAPVLAAQVPATATPSATETVAPTKATPPTSIRVGDKVMFNGELHTVTKPLKEGRKAVGVVATRDSDTNPSKGIQTVLLKGDEAIRARIEAQDAESKQPKAPAAATPTATETVAPTPTQDLRIGKSGKAIQEGGDAAIDAELEYLNTKGDAGKWFSREGVEYEERNFSSEYQEVSHLTGDAYVKAVRPIIADLEAARERSFAPTRKVTKEHEEMLAKAYATMPSPSEKERHFTSHRENAIFALTDEQLKEMGALLGLKIGRNQSKTAFVERLSDGPFEGAWAAYNKVTASDSVMPAAANGNTLKSQQASAKPTNLKEGIAQVRAKKQAQARADIGPSAINSGVSNKAESTRPADAQADREAKNFAWVEKSTGYEPARPNGRPYALNTNIGKNLRVATAFGAKPKLNDTNRYFASPEEAQSWGEANGYLVGGNPYEKNSQSAESTKPANPKEGAASTKAPKQKTADALRAEADLMSALADLGDIFGKNTRMNMMPEQEAKIFPVMVRLFDAAFRLGYHKFKDASKFALDKIQASLGQDVADQIDLEHLQGAYIAMSSGKKGADKIGDVGKVEAKYEIENHTAQTEDERENANAPKDAAQTTLTEHLHQQIVAGNMPKDNPALKKLVEAYDKKPADQIRMKQAQEELETAIAMKARDIVAEGKSDKATFDALLKMYEGQPNLNIRTSTSVANQAYSTPAPLAFLASRLAGVTESTVVHEPTAGTGMLLIGANPKNAIVNELNDLRIGALKLQGFNPTQKDAATQGLAPNGVKTDAVVTNPPFGSIKDDAGKIAKVTVDGYNLGQIDHLIAARALGTMKDDGKATLILGANKAAGGLSTDDRIFFNWLYSHYNVTGHFEVEGGLYARQGAGWPVRVITIDGREKSANISPVAGTIQRADNWGQVYEQFNQILDSRGQPNRGTSDAAVRPGDGQTKPAGVPAPAGPKATSTGKRIAETGESGNGNVARASAGTVADRTGSTTDPVGHIPDEQRLNGQSFVPPRLDEDRANTVATTERPAKPARAASVTTKPEAGNEFQSSYVPRSARKDEGVLIPSNMAQPTQDALSRLEDAVGDIDEFARSELGYESTEAMHSALMGLQVDSVAMAIYQIKQNKAVVIADQTGIGKGRQAAAIIRWAAKSGMMPIFVSVKPSLFTDMYGDLADIGSHDVSPLIMNSSDVIYGANGEKLFANKPSLHRSTIQSIASSSSLPEGSNALFMTYSQINTENLQRQALMALAPNAVFVLDESHNAAGDSGTGAFMISALKEARGVAYLSATYAKRPDNMPLYFKTDIGDAASDAQGLSDAMAAGGLPLQTVVSNNLVKAGQMFRRERSYDGVSISSIFDTKSRDLHERLSDEATEALRAIVSADKMFHSVFVKSMAKELKAQGENIQDTAGNKAATGVQHTEFSSVVHNFVRQMLLGLKAQKAADEAIASLKRGEKPIIAVENTMGSFLAEYAAQNNIAQGGSLGSFDYRTVLSRALERSRTIVVVGQTGEKSKKNISLLQLDPITRKAYDAAQGIIDGLAIDIPVSPIDWIRSEIIKAGHSVAEITGRSLSVDYSNSRKPVLSAIDLTEQRDKVASTRLFNGGELDALILNVAGSTGISLHASEKFLDQRQRHMIVAQAAGDINIFMQMLGRIHRTGQVRLPKYTILSVDLPTEKRPTAVLSGKMKSLNANTSSNTESATSVKAADILNKYGDQIVNQYLADNMGLAKQLGVDDVVSVNGEGVEPDISRKATGRLALQPIETQRAFYEDVEAQYDALIEYLNKTNQNDLEPRTFDFDAKEVRTEILFDGPNKATPFGEDAVYGEYSIKAQGEPMKPNEIREAIAESLGGLDAGDYSRNMVSQLLQTYANQLNSERTKNGMEAGKFNADKYIAFMKRIYGEHTADRWISNANGYIAQGRAPEKITPESLTKALGSVVGIDFIQDHPIGSTFRIDINSEQYNAVIVNVRNTHKTTGSPFSLSKIQLTVAVNGSLRSLTVPATQFRKIAVSQIAPHFKIEQLFREQPSNQRESAKIVTGNLLAAYGEIKGVRGTIISFTRADGVTEQGILLPKAFEYSKNTQGDYRLRTGADALRFLQNSNNENIGQLGIATRDGLVRVLPRGEGIQVRVPKSKAQGARYFLDKKLISVFGDFVSTSSAMTASVNDAAGATKALDLLMDKQALYALPSMADEAKSMAAKSDAKPTPAASLKEGIEKIQADKKAEALKPKASTGTEQQAPLTPLTKIRTAITQAYGKLLAQLEQRGLVTLTQTQEQAIEAAAQLRAQKTGQSVEQVKRGMMASVLNSIRAWHGSPHKFGKFSLDAMGSGEGAQAFGWGLYFADRKELAENYRKTLSAATYITPKGLQRGGDVWQSAFEAAKSEDIHRDFAYRIASDLTQWIDEGRLAKTYLKTYKAAASMEDGYKAAIAALDGVKKNKGQLYEASIAPNEDEFVLWDKPLNEQPQKMQEAIASAQKFAEGKGEDLGNNPTGKALYKALEEALDSDEKASKYLASIGIKGVKFLDGSSRSKGDGSHNYVVFDDADVEIVDVKFSANGQVQGFFDPQTGHAFLIADNLTTEAAPGVLMHEVGVHMAADGAMKAIFNRAALMLKAQKADPFMKAVQAKLDAAGETSAEEAAAYLVEAYENGRTSAPASVKRWLTDLLAAVKAWLHNKGFIDADRLTVADIAAVARASAKSFARGQAFSMPESNDGDVMFSLNSNNEAIKSSMGEMNAAQEAAYLNVTGFKQVPTMKERFDSLKANFGLKMRHGIVDQFAPIKAISQYAYMMARMSKASDGTMESAMLYGKPFLRDEVPDVDINDGGFAKVLATLGGEHYRFMTWVAAQRGEQLKAQGKENLMTGQDISALKTLNAGTMGNGKIRTLVYAKALQDLNAFNDAVLQMMVESGLIDQEARDLFKDQPYVPFYRLMIEEGGMQGPRFSSGLVNQKAWQKLKGGEEKLNADLLQNMLLNWAHLYSAAAKNRAALASMDAAEKLGIAHIVPSTTKDAIKVMRDGKAEHWAVEDPYLLEAVSALHYAPSPLMKPLAKMKQILTFGVTVNPTLKIRNLIRDSVSAIAQGDLSYNPAKNISEGWKLTASDSQIYASMLASGGVIKFGSQENTDRLRAQVAKLGGKVLDKSGMAQLTGQMNALWDTYQEFGDRTESINRAALYDRLIKKGHSHAEASFMARDLMDFSMSGSFPVVRFLTQTVPFLNARLVGLDKLGRAAMDDPRRFATIAGAVSLASLALMAAHGDDDDWKKREDFDRDSYWWFKIGSTAYRIPKPFEIGAIGTLAERTAELMFSQEMTGKRYMERIRHMFSQTFSMNPVPQAFKPLLDVYSNKDSFTGRAIESQADQRLRPQDRYNERTSEVARLLGQLGLPHPAKLVMGQYEAMSPKQLDSLLRGYFSWLAVAGTTASDAVMRPLAGRGERPELRLKDAFVAGNFAESLPSGSSRYVSQMYEQSHAVQQAYASYREALKMGDTNKAQSIMEQDGDKIRDHRAYAHATELLSKINTQAKRIEANVMIPGSVKRTQLEALEQRRGQIAKSLIKQAV